LNFEGLLSEVERITKTVNSHLTTYISAYFRTNRGLCRKVEYALSERGLRIRPFLVWMGYQIGEGNFRNIPPIAVAIEFMQIATLVIDDILDESEIRNGKQTVVRKWGVKTAILVGELLKSISSQIFLRAIKESNRFQRTSEALQLFENTYSQICIGQYLDLKYEKERIISEAQYFDMIEKTTARFIQAPIEIGALLSGAPREIVKRLSNYGLFLGYAYQIRDDIIDIIGEEKYTGKPFAGDIKQKKKRLPLIFVLTRAPELYKKRMKSFLAKETLDKKDLNEISQILLESGAVDYSIEMTKDFSKRAIGEIDKLKNKQVSGLLTDLAHLVSTFDN
jgi:geranylgeranyl diphosphate synthase type I